MTTRETPCLAWQISLQHVSALRLQMTKLWPHCWPDLPHSSTIMIQQPHNSQTTSSVFSFDEMSYTFHKAKKNSSYIQPTSHLKDKAPFSLLFILTCILKTCVLHKRKEATSFLKEISFIKAWSECTYGRNFTGFKIKLTPRSKAFHVHPVHFPTCDRRNKYREETSLERHVTLTFRR